MSLLAVPSANEKSCQSCGSPLGDGSACGQCGLVSGDVPAYYEISADDRSPAAAVVTAPVAGAIGGALGAIVAERFDVLRTVGMGAVGMVYEARERETGALVALKVLRPALRKNPEVVMRFRREVEIARRIDHPNVARALSLHEVEGHLYIVMQYIDGMDLNEYQRVQKPSLEQKIAILKGVAKAVDAAHAAGVVHRDLKPANIRVARDGTPYVLDFGVAALDEGGETTRIGAFIGTPLYMSPEQAQGKKVDHRTDIYSLGAIFYELVTGRPPFIGESSVAIALKHVRETPFKPRSLNPAIPPVVEQVILKCLEKAPSSRPQRASHIVEEIEGALARELVQAKGVARLAAQEPNSGNLGDISLFQYLRVLVPIRRNFVLEIVNNEEFGRYHFRGAHLVHAEALNLRDEEVAYNLFYWTSGTFRVITDAEPPPKETVRIPWIPLVERYFERLRTLMLGVHGVVPGGAVLDLLDPRGASVYRYASDPSFERTLGDRAAVTMEAFLKARTHLKSNDVLKLSKKGDDASVLFCYVPGIRHYFYAVVEPRANIDAVYLWIKGELERAMIAALHDCMKETDERRSAGHVRAKVLVVENEAFLGNLVRIQFRAHGMDVYLVRDGTKARQVAEEFKPDVIVLNLNMSGLSGYDLTRAFSENPVLARVPIILLVRPEDRDGLGEVSLPGVVRLVEKPIVLDELVDLVRRASVRTAQAAARGAVAVRR